MSNDDKQKTFNFRDWIAPSVSAIVITPLFVVILFFLCDAQLSELSKDLSDIAITFAFTFLGFLISAYAILQTVVADQPAPESIKAMNISQKEKFNRRAKMKIMGSSIFKTFKQNLLRVAFLSLLFLLACIALKPLIYLESRLFLLTINELEIFGIVFISSAGYRNLKTLFELI
ncbi:MAG: hypothetical protein JJE17_04755 [Peptostreptococcaceae bacterium]|nr:hypothetical protein [Peptostreptococcaceae bacterium]